MPKTRNLISRFILFDFQSMLRLILLLGFLFSFYKLENFFSPKTFFFLHCKNKNYPKMNVNLFVINIPQGNVAIDGGHCHDWRFEAIDETIGKCDVGNFAAMVAQRCQFSQRLP